MIFENPILAGLTLIREAIRSENYVVGSAGWSIDQDGSAEFNDVVIRGGTTVGGDFLAYNGVPALGNLVLSISAMGGTDSFGNVYQAGAVSYGTVGGVNYFSAINGAEITLGVKGGTAIDAFIQFNYLGGNVYELFMTSGRQGATFQNANISLVSETAVGAGDEAIFLDATNVSVTGNVTAQNIKADVVSVPAAAVADQWSPNVAVAFTGTFKTAPVVVATPSVGGPAPGTTTTLEWLITGITTSGFNIRVRRGNLSATTLNWLAISV